MNALFSIVASLLFVFAQDLSVVREHYYAASKTKENAEQFYLALHDYSKDNKVLVAYKGAAIALKSKYTTDKKKRKELLTQGLKLVESSVKSLPNNAEIRLIRLSIQEHTPKFLKYKGNIAEDKKMIVEAFDKLPKDLKEYIKIYAKQSKVFTEEDKKIILK